MAFISEEFELSVTPGSRPPTLDISQYDNSREYIAKLVDDDGAFFEIPSGATITFQGVNRGGVPFEIPATYDAISRVTFVPDEVVTDQPGEVRSQLVIKVGTEQIATLVIFLDVQRAGATKEEISGGEYFVDVVTAAAEHAAETATAQAAQYAQEAKDAALSLPTGGQAGQVLVSDGSGGAKWETLSDPTGIPNGDGVSY